MPTLARAFPFVRLLDFANVLTLFNIGLAFGTFYFALQRRFVLAATVIYLAAMLDFLDGHIARRYLAANNAQRAFGKHLDSFADLLNFSITPALVILILQPSLSATLAAATLVFTAILRLSLFGMSSTSADGGYQGLPTTYSGFVFALALMGLSAGHYGAGVIVGLVTLVGILQVTSLRIPKYGAPSTVACFALLFGLSTIYFRLL